MTTNEERIAALHAEIDEAHARLAEANRPPPPPPMPPTPPTPLSPAASRLAEEMERRLPEMPAEKRRKLAVEAAQRGYIGTGVGGSLVRKSAEGLQSLGLHVLATPDHVEKAEDNARLGAALEGRTWRRPPPRELSDFEKKMGRSFESVLLGGDE